MKINASSVIVGEKVIFVPYLRHHVEKYHFWMTSIELQELTASQPLSLDEEYSMQESWQNDDDKCTFIVLDRIKYEESGDEVASMIGDTNAYITDPETPNIAEIEVMLADKNARGCGRGRETTVMMLRYCAQNLNIEKFVAKIGYQNAPSINLFTSLGFKEITRSEVFQEITMEKKLTKSWLNWMMSETPRYTIQKYVPNGKYQY
ncbi:N-acetyltransferase 9-like protein [Hyalella azteca]|uniref:N-acetyltransferase 9-like protein n=1 Tax=Hyalella azteca TaxID=294128 RepID=A0A8B7N9F9_HYAAZ|nr:N-acetyltransferase 9-like protein [Hyalella azteca]XP_018009999.1 N-acetyltransferase 9-like protein [Hyalella azteca]XP_018010000.1 N-acetyltransferase 9-like protein [Hyalella azteca]